MAPFLCDMDKICSVISKRTGARRELNPRPPAPKAGIIPLDHWPVHNSFCYIVVRVKHSGVILQMKKTGVRRESNPRPPAPEAGIVTTRPRTPSQVINTCLCSLLTIGTKSKHEKERARPESNRRPQDLQSHALPLSYTPIQ